MIQTYMNLLDREVLDTLELMCKEWDAPMIMGPNSYYHRVYVDNEILKGYYKRMDVGNWDKVTTWINRVGVGTNTDDPFHNDDSVVSMVTYLNDGYEGGEFEYLNGKGKGVIIKPEKGMSLLIGRELKHRVREVTKGERFSLITFFRNKEKEVKTLL